MKNIISLILISFLIGCTSASQFGAGVNITFDPRTIGMEVLDGRIFISGKVDEPEEKIKITKMAWETKGVRSVKNAIIIKGQSNFKSTAKDILITSQLRTALIFNKKTKARNYTLETVNKNIYIFGIAMNEEEKNEVMNEANKIYEVEKVIPSIYLASELSRTKVN